MKKAIASVRAPLGILFVFTLLLGGLYPLIVTAVSQMVFNDKAAGSLIVKDGKVIGSALIGQEFTENKYFWGRLSAASPAYNAAASGGSNLSPTSPKILDAANIRMAALQKAYPKNKAKIPLELITTSASGLDPHISLLAVEYQIGRVAKARGLKEDDVQALIIDHLDAQSKIFGKPYVNVLELNLALDGKK